MTYFYLLYSLLSYMILMTIFDLSGRLSMITMSFVVLCWYNFSA